MKVKICGITNADDLLLADAAGADFAGVVLWPRSKRFVPPGRLAELARVPARPRRAGGSVGGPPPAGAPVPHPPRSRQPQRTNRQPAFTGRHCPTRRPGIRREKK